MIMKFPHPVIRSLLTKRANHVVIIFYHPLDFSHPSVGAISNSDGACDFDLLGRIGLFRQNLF